MVSPEHVPSLFDFHLASFWLYQATLCAIASRGIRTPSTTTAPSHHTERPRPAPIPTNLDMVSLTRLRTRCAGDLTKPSAPPRTPARCSDMPHTAGQGHAHVQPTGPENLSAEGSDRKIREALTVRAGRPGREPT
ncbi:MAG: hypothetical protein AMXMBFR64_54870 [Myxococcales bacterium]